MSRSMTPRYIFPPLSAPDFSVTHLGKDGLKRPDRPYTTGVCLITINLLTSAEVLGPCFVRFAFRGTPIIGIHNATKMAAIDIELF